MTRKSPVGWAAREVIRRWGKESLRVHRAEEKVRSRCLSSSILCRWCSWRLIFFAHRFSPQNPTCCLRMFNLTSCSSYLIFGKSLREIMYVWLLERISANGFVLGYRRAVAEWQLTCWTTLKDDVVVFFSNRKWAYFFILFVLIFDITTCIIHKWLSGIRYFFWMGQTLLIGYLQVKFQKYQNIYSVAMEVTYLHRVWS